MIIISPLTGNHPRLMLCPPSQKTEAGFRSPRQGHHRPQSHVVFLCPPKTRAAFCRARSVMVGCIEQPVKRLAWPCRYCELDTLHRPTFRSNGRRLIPSTRKTAMTPHAQNPANSGQATPQQGPVSAPLNRRASIAAGNGPTANQTPTKNPPVTPQTYQHPAPQRLGRQIKTITKAGK